MTIVISTKCIIIIIISPKKSVIAYVSKTEFAIKVPNKNTQTP